MLEAAAKACGLTAQGGTSSRRTKRHRASFRHPSFCRPFCRPGRHASACVTTLGPNKPVSEPLKQGLRAQANRENWIHALQSMLCLATPPHLSLSRRPNSLRPEVRSNDGCVGTNGPIHHRHVRSSETRAATSQEAKVAVSPRSPESYARARGGACGRAPAPNLGGTSGTANPHAANMRDQGSRVDGSLGLPSSRRESTPAVQE